MIAWQPAGEPSIPARQQPALALEYGRSRDADDADLLRDTDTTPRDYDLILTGDLGFVGGALLRELLRREEFDLTETHNDCGMMIYDREKQDVHAGGSGCGCSASVLCSHIFDEMRRGRYRRILFAATGALLSATSALQGASIPGIAHAVVIESGERMTDR